MNTNFLCGRFKKVSQLKYQKRTKNKNKNVKLRKQSSQTLSHPSMRGQKVRSPIGANDAVTPSVPKPQISRHLSLPTNNNNLRFPSSPRITQNGPQPAHRSLRLAPPEGFRQHHLRRGHQPREQDHCPQYPCLRCMFCPFHQFDFLL